MTSAALRVEVAALDDSARFLAAWEDLAGRAEPNAFALAAFVAPALPRLAGRADVRLLLIWRADALIGLACVEAPRYPLGFARIWQSEQAALTAALFDRQAAAAALAAVLTWVRRAFPLAAGLVVGCVERGGDLACVLAAAGAIELAAFSRATLQPGSVRGGGESARRRKEARRLERRLAERGRTQLRVGSDSAAIERFLALEALGWKGARGTALARQPDRAQFAREMLAGFAATGRLQIFELRCADALVASGLVLRSGRRAFYWKTAYNEGYADYSPGAALARALGRRLADDPAVDCVDSCAAPDHPMIDRLWSDRLQLVDLAAPLAAPRRFRAALAFERFLRSARERLKRVVLPLLGRKRS